MLKARSRTCTEEGITALGFGEILGLVVQGEREVSEGLRTWEWGFDMRERMRRNASWMAASEARADDLMARRRTGSTAGAVVEVARSIRDAMEESAAAGDEEGSEPSSASAAGRGGARPLAKEEEAVGRGMAAIHWDRRTRGNRSPCWMRLLGSDEAGDFGSDLLSGLWARAGLMSVHLDMINCLRENLVPGFY